MRASGEKSERVPSEPRPSPSRPAPSRSRRTARERGSPERASPERAPPARPRADPAERERAVRLSPVRSSSDFRPIFARPSPPAAGSGVPETRPVRRVERRSVASASGARASLAPDGSGRAGSRPRGGSLAGEGSVDRKPRRAPGGGTASGGGVPPARSRVPGARGVSPRRRGTRGAPLEGFRGEVESREVTSVRRSACPVPPGSDRGEARGDPRGEPRDDPRRGPEPAPGGPRRGGRGEGNGSASARPAPDPRPPPPPTRPPGAELRPRRCLRPRWSAGRAVLPPDPVAPSLRGGGGGREGGKTVVRSGSRPKPATSLSPPRTDRPLGDGRSRGERLETGRRRLPG